jgi:S-DNA-T family DNA segregation ATPase FtsK/SpoIIIE
MAKKKKNKRVERKYKGQEGYREGKSYPILTLRLRKNIGVVLIFLIAIIIGLSFFNKSGIVGKSLFQGVYILVGKTIFLIPLFLGLAGLVFLKSEKKRLATPVFLAVALLILGISGLLATRDLTQRDGGWLGYINSCPLLNYLGPWVTPIIFSVLILIGLLIFWEFLPHKPFAIAREVKELRSSPPFAVARGIEKKKIEFQMKDIAPPLIKRGEAGAVVDGGLLTEELEGDELAVKESIQYKFPPLDLLEVNHEKAVSAGDIEANSFQIKKTLQNFGIPVEMSEVNVGPTVTQYTLKPAEGIKLSRITALTSNLSLALAAHPLRIETPIPGRSLVGIEVPNKTRALVRLRELISSPSFQDSPLPLIFCLGKDVSGKPIFADLGKMPHLLVAGSTGSGKTICLNSLILSLIYRNSPRTLKFILVDPKRVEFPAYNGLPHLLGPIILNGQKAVNVLNWLTGEMERRFEVLAAVKATDITSYNKIIRGRKDITLSSSMPYIVLIIDELADLMAAKGREIEAGIVRLSQMARAVGIHLVVATQRPSVEVITGLIKANITSRVAFQVPSQIDSRTILDGAGAETLLGGGDMLFISSQLSRPKRIQGAYISPREIKKIVAFCKKESPGEDDELRSSSRFANARVGDESKDEQETLEESLEKELTEPESSSGISMLEDDSLYEEAKRVVIESNKASASLLQRRLRVGYARAARLLDILEEKGVIGPGEGAKPRKIYLKEDGTKESNDEWQKV